MALKPFKCHPFLMKCAPFGPSMVMELLCVTPGIQGTDKR